MCHLPGPDHYRRYHHRQKTRRPARSRRPTGSLQRFHRRRLLLRSILRLQNRLCCLPGPDRCRSRNPHRKSPRPARSHRPIGSLQTSLRYPSSFLPGPDRRRTHDRHRMIRRSVPFHLPTGNLRRNPHLQQILRLQNRLCCLPGPDRCRSRNLHRRYPPLLSSRFHHRTGNPRRKCPRRRIRRLRIPAPPSVPRSASIPGADPDPPPSRRLPRCCIPRRNRPSSTIRGIRIPASSPGRHRCRWCSLRTCGRTK